jgi:hypothetical protein
MDRERMRKAMEDMRPNPNPRVVALVDYAIDQIAPRLTHNEWYADWLAWAARWRSGERVPQDCVNAANACFEKRDQINPLFHTLGQLAWGAKEACYTTSKGGWLTVRYIADAMVTFGVAFPEEGLAALEPPTKTVTPRSLDAGQPTR